jgi:hypothetical protein
MDPAILFLLLWCLVLPRLSGFRVILLIPRSLLVSAFLLLGLNFVTLLAVANAFIG